MLFIFFIFSLLHSALFASEYNTTKNIRSTSSLSTQSSLYSSSSEHSLSQRTSFDLPVKVLVSNDTRFQWNPYAKSRLSCSQLPVKIKVSNNTRFQWHPYARSTQRTINAQTPRNLPSAI